jgi:hypothetical protein
MKTFIALFSFTQFGELHSNTRFIEAQSWSDALSIAEKHLIGILNVMKDSGVTEVQLQSLTFTNP